MQSRLHLPLLLFALLPPTAAVSQSTPTAAPHAIHIRILDGKTGAPVPNLELSIYTGRGGGKPLPITNDGDAYKLDASGLATLQFGEMTSRTPEQTHFTACQTAVPFFEVQEIETKGIASQNNCSKKPLAISAAPGELILFVRKTPWWNQWKDER